MAANLLAQAARSEPYVNLTAAEAATVEAVVARLIPRDANGPGALEAGAARYIDGALGDALAAQRPAYAAGLGRLTVHSTLGQLLNAEVELLAPTPTMR